MASERHPRTTPRERTFAELFPWRNLRRAGALVVLILAIVLIKRSVGGMLARVGQMWVAPTARPSVSAPSAAPASAGHDLTGGGFGVHLGPGLAPSRGTPAPAPIAPAPPPSSPPPAGPP